MLSDVKCISVLQYRLTRKEDGSAEIKSRRTLHENVFVVADLGRVLSQSTHYRLSKPSGEMNVRQRRCPRPMSSQPTATGPSHSLTGFGTVCRQSGSFAA